MKSYSIFLSPSDLCSLSLMPSGSIHIVVNGRISLFLWLNDSPHIYPIFFVHSSANRYSGCSPYLGYYKKCCSECGGADTSLRFWFPLLQAYASLKVELLDHTACLFWVFWGTSTLFFSVCTNLHSQDSIQGSLFPTSAPSICYLLSNQSKW